MSIFEDPSSAHTQTDTQQKASQAVFWGGNKGLWWLGGSFLLTLMLAFLPVPYVIQQPGPVYDTLGTSDPLGRTSDGKGRQLIAISGTQTYETSGTLAMLTVNILGNPDQRPSWFQIAQAWFDRSKAVVPIEAIFPPGTTTKQNDERNASLMVDSQKESVAAALRALEIEFVAQVQVHGVIEGGPSVAKLEEGDRILSVNDAPTTSPAVLRNLIAHVPKGESAQVRFVRDGQEQVVDIVPVDSVSGPVIGVEIGSYYEFPFDVEIQLDNVGGPSAGQMFTLGIMDKLTPEPLTGGKRVAGTGTINQDGDIGPIGGVQQKMYAARRDGESEYFLAPQQNCEEAARNIPRGLEVFSIRTLEDSLRVLSALREGTPTKDLPHC